MMGGKVIDYADWIGNGEIISDQVTARSVAGMTATLDRDDRTPQIGDNLAPLWHWMYFGTKARQSKLGLDGHPKRGDLLPPVTLLRRMFAGAQYRFHEPLRIGDNITRQGTIGDVTTKQGRSGELVFAKVNYVISTQRSVALEEDHDIVYRRGQE
jgi:3-methylfumaryl-CoA hydratase